ncbi:hypothetical protein JRO89_XS09G0172400 [Xanthoceras sorbifolium]|uniref:F-box domain-containing protein n=1 Tax=Xanthoceras sorbifolium TaxID=99658 RepID=A0ABQ8HLL4_9ROSI|nr:hypothetical protein JRO89_XS09G0172400 [Xanthoceras sorbifolium]
MNFADLKIMGDMVDDIDRISELPPFIVHQIMSYLSANEVAQTSILSKRWHCLQRSFPILDFDEAYTHFMSFSYPIFFRRKRGRFRISIEKFIEYIDASLIRFCELKLSMQKFKLLISLLDIQESSSVLDKWIGLAVDSAVKELDFDVRTLRDSVYTLPQITFSAKLLTTLKLASCKLEQPSDTIRFHSLKSITLNYVCISEGMLQKLTSECLLLEELFMLDCWGMKYVHVSEAHKLKIISIYFSSNELESVKIVVPSLQQLLLSSSNPQRRPVDISGCTKMNTLELAGFTFTDQEFHHLISKCPLLENLKVISCHSLERLVISSDRLKNLSIVTCSDLKAIDIDTPNLVSFTYLSNPVPISSKIKAPCPWKVDLENKDDPDTQWYVSIKEFIGVSNQIEDLTLHVTSERISFNLDEFRSSLPAAPCEVGNLCVEINAPTSNYAAFLDGVLNVCYPRTLSVLKTRETHNNLVEWLYKKMMNRDANCCNSYDVKCWRHYLKDFMIGGFVPDGSQKCFRIDKLIEVLPKIPKGTFLFHLDWCFTEAECCAEKA